MRFKIDHAIITSATKCEKSRACLEGTDHVCCSVREYVRHRTCFVECRSDEPCAYKSILAGLAVCSCPVRTEIFNRYGK